MTRSPVSSRGVGRGGWATLPVVAGGLFLAVMSTTLVSVALPTIGRDLGAGAGELEWIVDAYVLVYASLLVAGGVIGDRRGRKGVFLLGVALFGLGALVCGLAPSIPLLLVGRVVQGLGPALLIPGSLTIIRASFEDDRQRALAVGLWSTASGLSLAVGPAVGGVIVAGLGWRWVFLINVPLAGALLGLAARAIVPIDPRRARTRFDWLGALLSTGAIAALTFAVIHGQTAGMASASTLAAFAAGLAALAGFAIWERRRDEPLVDVALFLRPAFAAANLAALIVFFSFVGAIVYFSAYFQQVQGHAPTRAGLEVSAIGVSFALASPLSGRLVGRLGPLGPMLAGLLISGAAMLALLRLGPSTDIQAIWWNFAVLGAGIGMCLTPMTQTAISAVESARAGMASAVHNALRQVGQVFGVAVLGLLVYAQLPNRQAAGRRLDAIDGQSFVTGLHHALWVSGLALLAAATLVAVLVARPPRPEARSPAAGPGRSREPLGMTQASA